MQDPNHCSGRFTENQSDWSWLESTRAHMVRVKAPAASHHGRFVLLLLLLFKSQINKRNEAGLKPQAGLQLLDLSGHITNKVTWSPKDGSVTCWGSWHSTKTKTFHHYFLLCSVVFPPWSPPNLQPAASHQTFFWVSFQRGLCRLEHANTAAGNATAPKQERKSKHAGRSVRTHTTILSQKHESTHRLFTLHQKLSIKSSSANFYNFRWASHKSDAVWNQTLSCVSELQSSVWSNTAGRWVELKV